MTITEAYQKKRELGSNILSAIQKFEKETGITIDEINLRHDTQVYGLARGLTVDVEVNCSL